MRIPTLSRWRAFASARYRPFQAIAIGQAFTGSYASDALFVPLLLRLGAPPALVILVGSVPIGASVLQALAPQILRRMNGDLRRLTLLLALAEVRGFVHAAVVAAIAVGAIDAPLGIALISATVAIGQTAGVLSASNIVLWTAVVLPDQERRLVGPRMGAANMALSTLLLLPAGAVLDAGLRSIGLWAYVGFFTAGGLASILTPLAVARLPYPGRVLVKTGEAKAEPLPEPFLRFTTAVAIASVGQGLIPYLSLYAIHVLGASAGFAVILSGSASAGALAGSLAAGSFLLGRVVQPGAPSFLRGPCRGGGNQRPRHPRQPGRPADAARGRGAIQRRGQRRSAGVQRATLSPRPARSSGAMPEHVRGGIRRRLCSRGSRVRCGPGGLRSRSAGPSTRPCSSDRG